MHADLQVHRPVERAAVITATGAFASVVLVFAAVLAVFAPTTASMVEIWRRSETFTHGFLVIPAVLWFVWTRREALARTPVRPSGWALLPLLAAGMLWLVGQVSASLAPAQFGMIAMIPCVIAALFGWAWVRTLAFPLAFLFFAVPFGEFLVPTLIDRTADFTVAALRLSGVPVYREANSFVIPSGRWSVVEACSGIRYLIASVMLGSLYAWLVYRTPRRRALFIAAAFVVPLVANWLRAYGIVMLGHLSDNRIATGVDHLIYGWVFFGILMTAMFWLGARWREDEVPAARGEDATGPVRFALPGRAVLVHGFVVALAIAAWPVAESALAQQADTRPLQPVTIAAANGWSAVDDGTPGGWRPDVHGARLSQVMTFAKDGRRVSVVIDAYRNQREGAKLVTSLNQLVYQDNTRWRVVDRAERPLEDADGRFTANVALIGGPGALLAAAQWYWLGPKRTTSDTAAKAELALDRLLMRTDTSAWVTVATPANESLRDAWPVLERFVREMGGSIQHGLQEMSAR